MNPLFKNSKGNDKQRPTNPINEADKAYHQGYNSFQFDRDHKTTLSYADVLPFEAVECVEADKIPFGNKHHIMTYTLQSRMLDDVYMKKSYYMLDMRSILPLNWEKVYREPAVGNDIPNSSVNCFTKSFLRIISEPAIFYANNGSELKNILSSSNGIDAVLKYIFILEYIFSDGALPARFGYHLSSLVAVTNDTYDTFDKYINYFYQQLRAYKDQFFVFWQPSGMSYGVDNFSDFSTFLELIRSYPEYCDISFGDSDEIWESFAQDVYDFFNALSFTAHDVLDAFPFNFSRIAAYQLVYSEYFTRDNIDNVYSAELYRQNMRSLVDPQGTYYFLYNGVYTLYDSLSGFMLEKAANLLFDYLIDSSKIIQDTFNDTLGVGYIFNLFMIRKSLRYGDYFIGSRPEPYSPLDMTAEVRDGKVSAIDQTKSILAQRFSNAVSRTGRNFSDYLIDVTGGYDVPDVTKPRWLASKTSRVDGFEVENTTSEDQGNIVTILNAKNSDYIYEVESGSPAIVIGVVSFSMMRNYSQSVDRFCFHEDRYDMFNKFFQFDGDQEVSAQELAPYLTGSYAYQIRNSEYKQRFPIVSGAWRDFLPPMFLIADRSFDIEYKDDYVYNINDFNIRSLNSEFDGFYSSLVNLGLASRFHFMVKFENYCNPKRKMARTPSIL